MKKWWIIPLFLIILAIAVNAKCGDYFCDTKEGEDCESCPDDCLCTRGPHGTELIECCNEFTCKECQECYCESRKCSSLKGFTSMFQKTKCYNNGSIDIEVKFLELNSVILTPDEDLKVYMKEKKADASFKEISGTWINPSREENYKYTKIADTSTFNSDTDLFKLPGKYYVRVKYKIGRSNSIFEDTEISCPGMPIEPIPTSKKEPKVEEVEPPREEEKPKEEAEGESTEEPVITKEPQKKSNLMWYIIAGIIILAIIIFFIRYEIKVSKKT